tara:strand:+ start:390 stop:692 length:303 start_codon:yes stop_codon:yes gene_type:complete
LHAIGIDIAWLDLRVVGAAITDVQFATAIAHLGLHAIRIAIAVTQRSLQAVATTTVCIGLHAICITIAAAQCSAHAVVVTFAWLHLRAICFVTAAAPPGL